MKKRVVNYRKNNETIHNCDNKAFTTKDKRIFDVDKEGSRVWRWSKAQNYCKDLKLDAYDDWRVASQKELFFLSTIYFPMDAKAM